MRRTHIGILGGSFNPIHMGHLILGEQARQSLSLKKVIFVPTNLSPHKVIKELARAQDRYRMVCLAVKDNPYFEACDIEIKRGGVSYTIETVREFRLRYRDAIFYFIAGSDFLKEFSAWKDTAKLLKICRFIIVDRPGYQLKSLPKYMQTITVTPLDISSSDIRRRNKNGLSIRYLVPEEVTRYIKKKRLYQQKDCIL